RKFRKLQIALIRMRAIFRIAATIIIFFALIKIVDLPQWYLNKEIFNFYPNHSLEIVGNEIVTTKQIMAQLKPINLPKKQVFLLDTKIIEKSLLQLNPIKKVYIRRFWFPARLKIVINERTPVLGVSPAPNIMPIAIFTDDDVIIHRNFLPLPKSKPYYFVLTYTDYRKWSSNHVYYLVYLSRLLETATNEKLIFIDLRNPDDVFVQLKDIRLRLGGLNKTVFKRTKRVSSVLSEAIKIKDDIDYIDLRWNNSVSIKLKSKDNVKQDNSKVDKQGNTNTNNTIN
ncbi:MAG: FtsQ-type POTRA domain-containing protein, partial [Candidatus Gastranaerophilales bacterium]|nr:FtsQ-type POTRA domain-containing protein [Candidatus Gastranaerophilales bacterium]